MNDLKTPNLPNPRPFPNEGKSEKLKEEDAFMIMHAKPCAACTAIKSVLISVVRLFRRPKYTNNKDGDD